MHKDIDGFHPANIGMLAMRGDTLELSWSYVRIHVLILWLCCKDDECSKAAKCVLVDYLDGVVFSVETLGAITLGKYLFLVNLNKGKKFI